MKEVNRLKVFQGHMDGKIEIEEASRILKRSPRSVYRMVAKVREKEQEGVLRRSWNKVSLRRVPDSIRRKLIFPGWREQPTGCLVLLHVAHKTGDMLRMSYWDTGGLCGFF